MVRRAIGALAVAALLAACGGGGAAEDAPSLDYVVGRDVFTTCAACHGAEGTGGVGPALATVLETFPACEDHVEWINLGSEGWKETHGETYGAQDKPIAGAMPSFSTTFSEKEIRQVALYERMRFGGADEATEAVACGLGS